ncbi:MAG: bifunctional sugar-1-phosphate nucleotidylyltransferase/acetyltransferase [Candidatus Hydrothermarchaeaceae archaeon]
MKAMILAAGKGTRLEPVTTGIPKAMLPLGPKPILHHLVDAVKDAGITEITLLVGHLEEQIREYFGDGSKFGVDIEYITQKERLGTAHAIGQAEFDGDFLVLNGDALVSSEGIEDIVSAHDSAATLALKKVENPQHYGVVKVHDGKVLEIIEKPQEFVSDLANIGVYAYSPAIFDAIKRTEKSRRGEYEITSSIELLINDKEFVRGVEISGRWLDIGNPWNYLDANKEVLGELKSEVPGTVENGVTVKGELILGEGSLIKSGTYIEGPVSIGKHTIIGPNAYLRKFSTIGSNCHIGNGVEIKNSIIMDGTKVPHLSYIGDSIIGTNCNAGAGTLVGNLRLDNENVKMKIRGELVDSGRRKLGCVIGNNTKLGLNVMINSGRKIGNDCTVGPGVIVYKDIPDGSRVVCKQELEER